MEFVEFSGRTVEEALTNATVNLGLTSDQIEYEVIDKGSTGFLGFNSKPAVIKARKKEEKPAVEEIVREETSEVEPIAEEKEEVKDTPAAQDNTERETVSLSDEECLNHINKFLGDVFEAMELEVEINVVKNEESNSFDVELKGKEMGVLIGKRGKTLDSLQYLLNLTLNKNSDKFIKVRLDTENYRQRRKETLENLAKNVAYKVKRTKKPVILEPMNPMERMIIHSSLQNDKFVSTHSEGEEPYRHVVVTLKKK